MCAFAPSCANTGSFKRHNWQLTFLQQRRRYYQHWWRIAAALHWHVAANWQQPYKSVANCCHRGTLYATLSLSALKIAQQNLFALHLLKFGCFYLGWHVAKSDQQNLKCCKFNAAGIFWFVDYQCRQRNGKQFRLIVQKQKPARRKHKRQINVIKAQLNFCNVRTPLFCMCAHWPCNTVRFIDCLIDWSLNVALCTVTGVWHVQHACWNYVYDANFKIISYYI